MANEVRSRMSGFGGVNYKEDKARKCSASRPTKTGFFANSMNN